MTNERKGYRFGGWFVDPELTKRINPGGILLSPTSLYPKWEPIPYPVKYLLNRGRNHPKNPTHVHAKCGVQKLYPASKPGQFFKGWFWKNKRMVFLPEGLTEMVILEARFGEIPTVYFETGRGGRVPSRQVDSQGYLEPFQPPRRIGYEFDGWFLDPEYRFAFDFKKPLLSSCTLYAKWKVINFRIELNLDGGWTRGAQIDSYNYESSTIILPVPFKPGYSFQGWYDHSGRSWRVIPSGSMGSLSLHAKWEQADFEVHGMIGSALEENDSFF